jgi:hypothetical protein
MMNPIPVINWSVLIPLAFLGFVALKLMSKSVRNWLTNPLTADHAGSTSLREIVRCWLAPTGVMVVFVALSGEFGHELEQWFSMTPFARIPAVVESQTVNSSQQTETDSGLGRPGWIDEGDTQIDDVKKIVLSSGLWSTEAEAIHELLPRTASIVRSDFAERHKNPFDRPAHRFLSDERLAQIAVKRHYLEPVTKQTGSMELPMCRLWQQIEISPTVRTEIYPVWKSAVLGNRVVIIGTLLSLMTLAASATSLFVKMKRRPNYGATYAAAVATSSATAWMAGDLLLAMWLCQ